MKTEKVITHLEKLIEKLEGLNHAFSTDELQNEFDTNKNDALILLNDMIEICHNEEDNVPEDEEESE